MGGVDSGIEVEEEDTGSGSASGRVRLGSSLKLVALVSLDKADIVVDQDFWLGYDAPLDLFQELHLQSSKFTDANTTNSCIGGIGPETIAETLRSDRRSCDEKTMDSQTANSKTWIKRAQAIDVVDDG